MQAFIPERWSNPDSPEYTAAAIAAASGNTPPNAAPPPKPAPVLREEQNKAGSVQCTDSSAENGSSSSSSSSSECKVGQYATLSGHSHAPATSLLPFGLGSRMCIGQPLANMQARILLVVSDVMHFAGDVHLFC